MKTFSRLVATFLVVVAAMVVGKYIANALAQPLIRAPNDVEAALVSKASELNKTYPKMEGPDIRADMAVAGPGKVFTYFFTYPSHASTDFDPRAFHAAMDPAVTKQICADPQMRMMFQAGVTVFFVNRGNDGVVVNQSSVTPSDCGI